MIMPLRKRLPIAHYQRWLGGLLLCGLCSPSFAAEEWEQVGSSSQYAIFMSAQRIKPVRSIAYESKPAKVEAWAKWVIVSDLVKDGRTVGDYNLTLNQYDCANDTLKLITTTSYKKNGETLETYASSGYTEPGRVVPDSIGEAQLKIACMVLDKINKGETITRLSTENPVEDDTDTQNMQQLVQKIRYALKEMFSQHTEGGMSLVMQKSKECYSSSKDVEFCLYMDIAAKILDDGFREFARSQKATEDSKEIEDMFPDVRDYYRDDNFNNRVKRFIVPRYAQENDFKQLLNSTFILVNTVGLAEEGNAAAQEKIDALLNVKKSRSAQAKQKPMPQSKAAKPVTVVPPPATPTKTRKLVRPNQQL